MHETPSVNLNDQQVPASDDDLRTANLYRMVTERLKPGRVLDVGCGDGGLITSLLAAGHDARGIDSSEPTIAAARRRLEGKGFDADRVSATRLETLVEAKETFENVVSMDCLEHAEDDETTFANLVKVVRPGGGRLVVTVPAMMWLYGRRDRDRGHYRRYDRRRLEELLVGQPLVVEELRFWNGLGVLPRVVAEKLLGSEMDESFYYGVERKRVLRTVLDRWFATVERWVRPPLGLTLILTATRLL